MSQQEQIEAARAAVIRAAIEWVGCYDDGTIPAQKKLTTAQLRLERAVARLEKAERGASQRAAERVQTWPEWKRKLSISGRS